MKKRIIELSEEQRQQVEQVIRSGTAPARNVMHAHILLNSEQGWSDQQIMDAFRTGEATIWRVRRRFLERGLEGCSLTSSPTRTARKAHFQWSA